MSDEPVDPRVALEKKCHPRCDSYMKEYEACGERIKGDTTGDAQCVAQYFQYFKCMDKCMVKDLFKALK